MGMFETLKRKRDEILEKIGSIETFRRGTINEQYLKVSRKNGEPVLKGPYYILSKSVKGKTVSERIKPKDLENVKSDVASYSEFINLTTEFVEITEQITNTVRTSKSTDEEPKKN